MPNLRISTNTIRFFFKTRTVYGLIFLVLTGWSLLLSISDHWTGDRIQHDVLEYYSYLPATFICKDISLKNPCEGRYWTFHTPNGRRAFRMTMGMSISYLPFFTIAHFIAPVFHEKQDGYSDPYQKMILFSSLFYAVLGLVFTFKALKIFFSERIAFITSLLLFFSTNLLNYSSIDAGTAHAFLFGMGAVFIYLVIKWHECVTFSRTIAIGLVLGLMTLTRPTSVLFAVLFLLYNITTKKEFIEKISFLFKNYMHLLVMGLSVFIIISPQLMYWKYVTGNWVYYSYTGQTFFWKHPHIIDGLFSFRKGWFIYTPILFIAWWGIFYIQKKVSQLFLPLVVFFSIFCYVTFSWWCWWYGGSFGQRSLVDTYGLMAFPLAGIISYASHKKVVKIFFVFACFFFVALNFFQSWQYSTGLLHYDAMTKDAYLKVFSKTTDTWDYYHALWEPDYLRAYQGKSEKFEPEELYGSKIAIKPYNLKFLSLRNLDTLAADTFEDSNLQHFTVVKVDANHVAIQASNNKFISVDKNKYNGLYAQCDTVCESAKFRIVFLNENYIALISSDNKYFRINYDTNLLIADSDSLSPESRWRVYFKN